MTTALHKHYKLLGLAYGADADQVKKAYRDAALQHHPDTDSGDEQIFIKVQHAYTVIMEQIDVSDEVVDNQSSTYAAPSGPVSEVFNDAEYDQYSYFEPSNQDTEYFERSIRAQNCRVCHGIGIVSMNVNPEKGFMGIEQRLCVCQRLEERGENE